MEDFTSHEIPISADPGRTNGDAESSKKQHQLHRRVGASGQTQSSAHELTWSPDLRQQEAPRSNDELQNSTQQQGNLESEEGALPLVVWLRGDEPLVEQFTWTAEDAMTALNIKRSRLTQISGRELRVGRMRMGRYVRPVYRPKDVLRYRDWTRPTATHKKSADALGEATKSLEQTTQSLLERFGDPSAKVVAVFADALRAIRKNQGRIEAKAEAIERRAATHQESSERFCQEILKRSAQSKAEMRHLTELVYEVAAGVASQQSTGNQQLSVLQQGFSKIHESLDAGRQTQEPALGKIFQALDEIRGEISRQAKEQAELCRRVSENQAAPRGRKPSRPHINSLRTDRPAALGGSDSSGSRERLSTAGRKPHRHRPCPRRYRHGRAVGPPSNQRR